MRSSSNFSCSWYMLRLYLLPIYILFSHSSCLRLRSNICCGSRLLYNLSSSSIILRLYILCSCRRLLENSIHILSGRSRLCNSFSCHIFRLSLCNSLSYIRCTLLYSLILHIRISLISNVLIIKNFLIF